MGEKKNSTRPHSTQAVFILIFLFRDGYWRWPLPFLSLARLASWGGFPSPSFVFLFPPTSFAGPHFSLKEIPMGRIFTFPHQKGPRCCWGIARAAAVVFQSPRRRRRIVWRFFFFHARIKGPWRKPPPPPPPPRLLFAFFGRPTSEVILVHHPRKPTSIDRVSRIAGIL